VKSALEKALDKKEDTYNNHLLKIAFIHEYCKGDKNGMQATTLRAPKRAEFKWRLTAMDDVDAHVDKFALSLAGLLNQRNEQYQTSEFGFKINECLSMLKGYKLDKERDPKSSKHCKLILDIADKGLMGKHIITFLEEVASGNAEKNVPALVAYVRGYAQLSARINRGVTNMKGGVRHQAAAINLSLGIGCESKTAARMMNKALLGCEAALQFPAQQLVSKFFGDESSFVEILDPNEQQRKTTIKFVVAALQRGALEGALPVQSDGRMLYDMHIDGTKTTQFMGYCYRRQVCVGGSCEGAAAKIPVANGSQVADFLADMEDRVLADQMNVVAISVHAPRHMAVEVGVYPFRHVRKGLSDSEIATLGYKHKSAVEFRHANEQLVVIHQHGDVPCIGCDGGVEGHDLVITYHTLEGPTAATVVRRGHSEDTGYLPQLGEPTVVCWTDKEKVQVGMIDPDHSEKAFRGQFLSSAHNDHAGTKQCMSVGFVAVLGVLMMWSGRLMEWQRI